MQALESQSAVRDQEVVLRTKSGELRNVILSIEIVQIEHRAYLLTMCIDVTASKRLAEQAALFRDELAHAARIGTLGELTSGLAHELNQPLTSLRLFAKLALDLGQKESSKELRECLERISDLTLRAGEIVRPMHAFAGARSSKRSEHNVNHLIQEVLKLLSPKLNSHKVRLTCELDESSPHLMVDGIQIQQVLVNLIRNAIEAMDDVSCESRFLSIQTESSERGVCVSIRDSGSGMDPKIAANLFQPFQTTKTNGLGLGLRICQTLLNAQQSSLEYYPNEDTGVTFRFLLPAGLAAKAEH